MSETPEQRKAAWEKYIDGHRDSADILRANQTALTEPQLREGLAKLHEGIALLADMARHKEANPAPTPTHIEHHKARITHLYSMAQFRFSSAGEFAQLAGRSIIIAHGGALIAMLAFLGNAHLVPEGQGVWWTFGAFVAGLVASLVAVLLAYQTQASYGLAETSAADMIYFHMIGDLENKNDSEKEIEPTRKRGQCYEIAAIVLYLAAVLLFIAGAGSGIATLSNMRSEPAGVVAHPQASPLPPAQAPSPDLPH